MIKKQFFALSLLISIAFNSQSGTLESEQCFNAVLDYSQTHSPVAHRAFTIAYAKLTNDEKIALQKNADIVGLELPPLSVDFSQSSHLKSSVISNENQQDPTTISQSLQGFFNGLQMCFNIEHEDQPKTMIDTLGKALISLFSELSDTEKAQADDMTVALYNQPFNQLQKRFSCSSSASSSQSTQQSQFFPGLTNQNLEGEFSSLEKFLFGSLTKEPSASSNNSNSNSNGSGNYQSSLFQQAITYFKSQPTPQNVSRVIEAFQELNYIEAITHLDTLKTILASFKNNLPTQSLASLKATILYCTKTIADLRQENKRLREMLESSSAPENPLKRPRQDS